jgi:hypothetical protein
MCMARPGLGRIDNYLLKVSMVQLGETDPGPGFGPKL